jgi:hypothetical protein
MPEIPEARKQWFQQRVEAIHNRVTAYDVLRHNGVDLKQNADDRAEQISCPFHGEDKDPSCRIYPSTGPDDPSHAWCFVCQEPNWDAIGLWRKFNGGLDNCSFSQALAGLEKAFGLETPDAPAGGYEEKEKRKTEEQEALEAFKKLYLACERRLVSCKSAYRHLDDLTGYLAAGSALDKIRYRVEQKLWLPERGVKSLEQLLDKISEKAGSSEGLSLERLKEMAGG